MANEISSIKPASISSRQDAPRDAKATASLAEFAKAKVAPYKQGNNTRPAAGKAVNAARGIMPPSTASVFLSPAAAATKSTPFTPAQLALIEKSYATGDVAATWKLMATFGDT